MNQPLPPNRAFSLVELILAIAVVAVLCSLLILKVKEARLAAKNVECVSHLMQSGRALLQYAAESGNQLLTGYGGNVGSHDLWGAKLVSGGYVSNPEVLRCPVGRTNVEFTQSSWPWQTYGLNFYQNGTVIRDPGTINRWKLRMSDIPAHSEFLLLADSCEVQSRTGTTMQSFRITNPFAGVNGGAAVYYHRGRANVFFADGHIGSLTRQDLLAISCRMVIENPTN